MTLIKWKSKIWLVAVAAIVSLSTSVFAADDVDPFAEPLPLYKEGAQYVTSFPDATPEKPTVVEFFSFGCPHCYSAEPQVKRWLSKKPENVNFVKIPVSFGRPEWTLFSKAYYIAKALKIEAKFTGSFFGLIHDQKRSPKSMADVKAFFGTIGVSAVNFDAAVKKHSFFIESSIKKADQLARKYRVPGVPHFLVNYKYTLGKEIRSEDDFHSILSGLALKDFKLRDGDYYLKSNKGGFLLIYAPWCGYCTMLKPEWVNFNKKNGKKYLIKTLNVENEKGGNKRLANNLGIGGFPTILFVTKTGKITSTKFDGDRSIENFEKYLEEKL